VRGRQLREAEALVRGALLLEPRDPSIRYLEAQLLARRGDYGRAREALDAVLRNAHEPELRAAASAFLARMNAVERAPES
jgi:Flp pilus assembly protein TadD